MITLLIISIIVLLAGLWFWKHGYELFLNEQEINKTIEEENDKLEIKNATFGCKSKAINSRYEF